MKTLISVVVLVLVISIPCWASQDERSTVLITGSNRGIGLALTRQCAEEGWMVIASCRRPENASELKKLAENYPGVITSECSPGTSRSG